MKEIEHTPATSVLTLVDIACGTDAPVAGCCVHTQRLLSTNVGCATVIDCCHRQKDSENGHLIFVHTTALEIYGYIHIPGSLVGLYLINAKNQLMY